MATATVERVTYREGNKYPQGSGPAGGVGEEAGPTLNEPLLPSTTTAPPPRSGQVIDNIHCVCKRFQSRYTSTETLNFHIKFMKHASSLVFPADILLSFYYFAEK